LSGIELEAGAVSGGSAEGREPDLHPTRCPSCGQRFSPDGRFCPFDGEALVRESEWDPKGDPLLDQVIDGRYRVEAVIGEGGMGTVYRVRHVVLDKSFALKALRADLANDPDIANRFIHEARVMASVTHPGLVQISDFGRLSSGQAYFVMELLGGASLRGLLRGGGAMAPARARAITKRIAEAIAVAHAAGIVHRDLKPDNVHVRSLETGDEIKIVDFGLAKVMGTSRLTRDGIIFGTPHYLSPEQAAGETPDQRADIYALGIVLYEMLTGQVPFEADSYMGVLTQHIYMKPRPPSELLGPAATLGELESIVLRCLEKKPERRFASMQDLARVLDEVPAKRLASSPESASAISPQRLVWDASVDSQTLASPPKRRTIPALLALGLVAASGVVGALVAWAIRDVPSTPERSATGASAATVRGVATQSSFRTVAEPGPPTRVADQAGPAPGSTSASARPAARSPRKVRSNGAPSAEPASQPPSTGIIDPWAKQAR
jgi:serine/threonine-protein kinase